MRRCVVVVAASLVLAGCGTKEAPPAVDTLARMKAMDDSVIALHTQQASALADSVRATMATLLKNPATAKFDSLIVVQPPKRDGIWSTPWVCGRIGGSPGIGGSNAMTPFIYQNRVNVFVLDASNREAFGALRAKGCDNPEGRVLLK